MARWDQSDTADSWLLLVLKTMSPVELKREAGNEANTPAERQLLRDELNRRAKAKKAEPAREARRPPHTVEVLDYDGAERVYYARCHTCGWMGRNYVHRRDAELDGDEHAGSMARADL
jgi:hypothetical protein